MNKIEMIKKWEINTTENRGVLNGKRKRVKNDLLINKKV